MNELKNRKLSRCINLMNFQTQNIKKKKKGTNFTQNYTGKNVNKIEKENKLILKE